MVVWQMYHQLQHVHATTRSMSKHKSKWLLVIILEDQPYSILGTVNLLYFLVTCHCSYFELALLAWRFQLETRMATGASEPLIEHDSSSPTYHWRKVSGERGGLCLESCFPPNFPSRTYQENLPSEPCLEASLRNLLPNLVWNLSLHRTPPPQPSIG